MGLLWSKSSVCVYHLGSENEGIAVTSARTSVRHLRCASDVIDSEAENTCCWRSRPLCLGPAHCKRVRGNQYNGGGAGGGAVCNELYERHRLWEFQLRLHRHRDTMSTLSSSAEKLRCCTQLQALSFTQRWAPASRIAESVFYRFAPQKVSDPGHFSAKSSYPADIGSYTVALPTLAQICQGFFRQSVIIHQCLCQICTAHWQKRLFTRFRSKFLAVWLSDVPVQINILENVAIANTLQLEGALQSFWSVCLVRFVLRMCTNWYFNHLTNHLIKINQSLNQSVNQSINEELH